jgi:aromatic ring-cleaving dioxygenase
MRTNPAPASDVRSPDLDVIKYYHAHVYYDPATTRARAAGLRERVAATFPQATLGRWHHELVGPHLQSMYQIGDDSFSLCHCVSDSANSSAFLEVRVPPRAALFLSVLPSWVAKMVANRSLAVLLQIKAGGR